jgi:hypothetical protein
MLREGIVVAAKEMEAAAANTTAALHANFSIPDFSLSSL